VRILVATLSAVLIFPGGAAAQSRITAVQVPVIPADGSPVTGRVFYAPPGYATYLIVAPAGGGGTQARVPLRWGDPSGFAEFSWTCGAEGIFAMTASLYSGNTPISSMTVQYRCVRPQPTPLRITGLIAPGPTLVGQYGSGHLYYDGGYDVKFVRFTSQTPGWASGDIPVRYVRIVDFTLPCPKPGHALYYVSVHTSQGASSDAWKLEFDCVSPTPTPTSQVRILKVTPPTAGGGGGAEGAGPGACKGGSVIFADPQNEVGVVRLMAVRAPPNWKMQQFSWAQATSGQKYFPLNVSQDATGFQWVLRVEFDSPGFGHTVAMQDISFTC
jgi:hypothetical protein